MSYQRVRRLSIVAAMIVVAVASPASPVQFAAPSSSSSATSIPEASLIQPEALLQALKSSEKEKPTILQVGSKVMFNQAHIPGAEYAGPGSQSAGIASLEDIVASLPKNKPIVLYCGCCPWNRCPNVGPAFKRLRDLGFSNVKVLYIASDFGDEWVSKGYPAVKGK
jgi:thiosulfate/3-mercaptopyruvate sulfurtransferase